MTNYSYRKIFQWLNFNIAVHNPLCFPTMLYLSDGCGVITNAFGSMTLEFLGLYLREQFGYFSQVAKYLIHYEGQLG